ncbi:sugar kinase, partial [Corallococcus exiguus]|nr:sugar kinase [Corallococcus exiguus]
SSTIIVDDEGERLIVAYSDPGMPADANWLTPRLERGVVLADLSWPQGAIAVLGAARDAGLPRVLDADRYRHDRALVDHVITLASHVIFSGPGLRQFTGQESVASGLAAIEGDFALIGVTDGSEGFFWRDGT